MAILFFIGCDKTGKSTLLKTLLNKTNKHICVDRFTPCQYVYGKLNNKSDTPSIEELKDIENFLSISPVPVAFILVEAEVEDIKARFELHNEKDIKLDDIENVMTKYREYLADCNLPVIEIYTSYRTIDDCVEEILNKVKDLEKEYEN